MTRFGPRQVKPKSHKFNVNLVTVYNLDNKKLTNCDQKKLAYII